MIENVVITSIPTNAERVISVGSGNGVAHRVRQVTSGPARKVYVVLTGPYEKVYFV